MANPWDRQENETTKAFEWFGNYLSMDVRSLRKLPEMWGKSGAYVGQLERWSSAYNWVQRAEAYDAYLEEEARKRADADFIERRSKVLERDWKMAEHGHTLIEKMLKMPLTTQRVTKERYGEDGQVIAEEITIEPVGWNLNTLRLLMDTTSKLGRNAVGLVESTQRHEHTGKDGEPLHPGVPLDLSGLDDDDLELFQSLLRKAADRSARAGEAEPEPT